MVVLVLSGQVHQVSAQDEISQKEQLTQEIDSLKKLYRDSVESYRLAEQEFVVAKGQYQQLNTLASLENAVQKTKAVLISRNQVLEVYLELVLTTLEDTSGVNLDQQSQVSSQISDTINDLRDYRQSLEESSDRNGVNQRADEFEELSDQVVSVAHKGMALIMIGRVQNVYDLSRLLHQDVKNAQEELELSTLKRQELERANQEIDRNFDQVLDKLILVREHVDDNQEKDVKSNYYERAQELLSPAYSDLTQIVSYLRESV